MKKRTGNSVPWAVQALPPRLWLFSGSRTIAPAMEAAHA